MNDTSATAPSTTPPIVSTVACRMLVRSSTTTRGSSRSLGWSWPWPTSRATTSAAPRDSRQSVNPPVDAPQSRTRRPPTSMSNRLECGVELLAAATDEPRRRTGDGEVVGGRDQSGRLVGGGAVDEHAPVGDQAPAPAPDSRSDRGAGARRRGGGERPPTERSQLDAAVFLAAVLRAAGAFFAAAPSWPGPSWRAPSWRRSRRRLLRRRLLGRPRPSWRAQPPARRPAWRRRHPTRGSRGPRAGPRRRRPGWRASRAAS